MKSILLVNALDAASDQQSPYLDLVDLQTYAVHVDFTAGAGNIVGTLTLEASLDASDWVTVSGSSQAVTASASHIWTVTGAGYRYVRVAWDYTSGSGNWTVRAFLKDTVTKGA